MAEVTVAPPCARHPEQASVATCGRCGRPLCEQCRVESVATDRVFCSERCLGSPSEVELDQETVSNKSLREGLKKPIRIGWALWARSVGSLVVAVVPLAAVGGALWWYMARSLDEGVDEYDRLVTILIVALMAVGAYGVAVVGIMLSQRHTRLVRENPHAKAARRLIVVYSAMHAPEIVQFYGMKAARASLDASELAQGNWLEREKNRQL